MGRADGGPPAEVPVVVSGSDRVAVVGAQAILRAAGCDTVVGTTGHPARILVLIEPLIRRDTLTALRGDAADRVCVLVTDRLRSHDLVPAVTAGVVSVLPRSTLAAHHLVAAVRSAATGNGHLTPGLTGALLAHLRRLDTDVLAPAGLGLSGLSDREASTLGLIGDGHSTDQVAALLGCSRRTVKYDLAEVMRRHRLRTRAHAVAHAVRSGAI